MGQDETTGEPGGADRRVHERFDTELSVDWSSGETFLFSYITNISEMGIFVASREPLPVGSMIKLTFKPGDLSDSFEVEGEVVWVDPVREGDANQSPGMGVKFVSLDDEQKEKIVHLIKTIAYLHDHWV